MTSYIYKNEYTTDIKKVCILCVYLHTRHLPAYILHYIKSLKKSGYDTIVVSHSQISEPDLEKLASVSCSVVIKENVGYDFFAWKFGMELIGDLSHLDYLLLVNDSIIGPFSDLSMIFNKMNEKFDFWGLTENYEYKFHIQSYFLHANKAVLNSENWLTFWNSLVVYDNKSEIVLNYEVELTQVLKKNKDIRIGAWVSQEELTTKFPSNLYTNYPNTSHWHGVANPTVKHWKELLTDFKFPFIKKNLFFEKEHYHYVYEEQVFVYNVLPVNWKNIIGKTYGQEGVALIEEYVDEFTNNHDGKSVLTNACYKVLFIYNTLASSAQIDYLARWIQFYNRHNIETELILDSPYSLQACVDIKLRDITKINILSELSHKQFEQLKHRISQEDIGTIIIGDPESVKIAQYFSYTNAPHILFS